MKSTPLEVGSPVRLRVEVRGVVQGVGFRPFVYRLAHKFDLNGWVRNTSGNVTIEVEGQEAEINRFLTSLKQEAPPVARIQDITTEALQIGGGSALMADSPLQRYFRDSRLCTITEGTSEIMEIVISRGIGLR